MDAPDYQCHRVVAYFDVDCFYAQAEVLRRPHLQNHPVGVTQKTLVVTCNYVARELGVPKMASIREAKQRCPHLVLFNGEDLTPYRAASKRIMAVLGRFGVLERRGLDEAALDITSEVVRRFTSMPCTEFSGHVIGMEWNCGGNLESSHTQGVDKHSRDHYIMIGSQVAMQIRVAVEKETGFKCSCGIASNKMLAKMVSSVNKPNQQTCLLDCAVSAFLRPLDVRKLPGVGNQTECVLKELGATTVADLQQISLQELSNKLGNRMGRMLYENCRGVDNSLVQDKGPPKSLSVEDSFQSCSSYNRAEDIIRRLAADLISRLDEDKEEYSRRPKVLCVKWRYPGNWAFKSASALMPPEALSGNVNISKRIDIVVTVAVKLLTKEIRQQPFSLAVLNVCATNFIPIFAGGSGASHDIRSFLGKREQVSKQTSKPVSKREARVFREECEGVKDSLKLHRPSVENSREGFLDDVIISSQCSGLGPKEHEYGGESMEFDGELLVPCSFMGECELALSSEMKFEADHRSTVKITEEHEYGGESMEFDGELLVPCSFMGECELASSSEMKFEADHRSTVKITEGIEINKISNADISGEIVSPARVMQEKVIGNANDQASETQFICQMCGNEVVRDPKSQQEHEDYHLALQLNSEEHELRMSITSKQELDDHQIALKLSSQEQLLPENLFHKPSMYCGRSKNKVRKTIISSQSAIKRKKIQKSILDCFIGMQN